MDLAVPADLSRVHALIESAYRGEAARAGWTHEADLIAGQRTDLATLQSIVADARQRLIVLRVDETILGSVVIQDKGGGTAYLGMLAVDPQRQTMGLGRALITAAELRAGEDFQAKRIEMTVIASRSMLIGYYQRRGYALTGERRPFPFHDRTIGTPLTDDLEFVVLARMVA